MASYSDDFNRPDSTNIGNWTESGDNWSIISQQLAPGTSTLSIVIYNSTLDTTDHYAEITLSNATATSMGVFARSDVGGNNFYLLRNNGTSWDLFSNIGGSFTNIGTYTAAPNNGDTARIHCVGSTIKGFINGVERISVTNTDITTGVYSGLRSEASSTARYDNFLAADISSTPSNDTGDFFAFLQS